MRQIIVSLLAGVALLAVNVQGQNVRTVRLMTPDDLGLSAAYYPVETNSAPAVILLHAWSKNRDEWSNIALQLQRNGIAALALDLRGHGESTRRITDAGPEMVEYQKLDKNDFKKMLLDVNQAFDWLADQPGIDRHRIAMAGSGFGANLAVRYAVFNDEIVALLLLSPGMVYQTVRADDVIIRIGKRPLRMAVSEGDGFAFESAKQLVELRKQHGQTVDTNELIVCSGSMHGVPMLEGVKGLTANLFGWLKQILLSPPPSP